MESLLPAFIADSMIRRRAGLSKIPMDRYRIHIARAADDYEDAFKLLHVAYVYQGYEAIRGVDMRITPHHVLPESTVLVAKEGDRVVGTMTVTLDSPAGLPLDRDYSEDLNALRAKRFSPDGTQPLGARPVGARPVEFGALAVVKRCWGTGVTTLLNMAAVWFSFNIIQGTDIVMGIHPKAGPVYRALFAFSPLGPVRPHAELFAPVLGMQVNLDTLSAHLRRNFKKKMTSGLTLGEHFFDTPPACIEMPESKDLGILKRWKLPRDVFQQLFIVQSQRIDSLDPKTRDYLGKLRSPTTLRLKHGVRFEDPSGS